jgi:hypothetical protein
MYLQRATKNSTTPGDLLWAYPEKILAMMKKAGLTKYRASGS